MGCTNNALAFLLQFLLEMYCSCHQKNVLKVLFRVGGRGQLFSCPQQLPSGASAVALLPHLEPQQSPSCPTWSLSSRPLAPLGASAVALLPHLEPQQSPSCPTWSLSSCPLAPLGASAVALLPHLEPQQSPSCPTWSLSSRPLAPLGASAVALLA